MITIPNLTFNEIFRFWTYVDRKSEDECWLFASSRDENRRPCFKLRNKNIIAARISYYIHYKVDPGDLFVCHNCLPNPDNFRCVNPNHLWLGTQTDNTKDWFNKGGRPSYGNTKLSQADKDEIRRLRKLGKSTTEIASLFDIRRETVWNIVTKQS